MFHYGSRVVSVSVAKKFSLVDDCLLVCFIVVVVFFACQRVMGKASVCYSR